MAIRFKCHQCKKPLAVKDHLAGKKVICPGCRKPIVIPRPKVSVEAAEEVAAKFLGDTPAKEAPKPQAAATSIKFTCEYCDEPVEAPASEAGKKMPCPECKHIISVPELKVEKPKDWRDLTKKGPSAALINQPEQLENAWGTEQKSKVSGTALLEAGAIPEPKGQSFALSIWLKRALWCLLVVGLVSMGLSSLRRNTDIKREKEALSDALAMITPVGKEAAKVKLAGDWAAEIHRVAGELYCAKGQPLPAQRHFRIARANLRDVPASLERDLLLIDLALDQIELGGSEDDIISKRKIPWTEVQQELNLTMESFEYRDARKMGMRLVGARLAEKNQLPLAIGIAAPLPTREQQIGLILAHKAVLEKAAADPDPKVSQPASKALADIEKQKLPTIPNAGPIDPSSRLAHVEGLARQRRFKESLDLACDLREKTLEELLQCVDACVGGAQLALADRTAPDNVAAAATFIRKAVELCKDCDDKDYVDRPIPFFALILAGIEADVPDVQALAVKLPKKVREDQQGEISLYQPRIQLALLRKKLASSKEQQKELSGFGDDAEEKALLSYALAWEALAEHNARLGRRRNDILDLDKSADERLRPFLLVGFALGQHHSK